MYSIYCILCLYCGNPGPYTEGLEAQGTGITTLFPQRALGIALALHHSERWETPAQEEGDQLQVRCIKEEMKLCLGVHMSFQYGESDRTEVPFLDDPFPIETE